MARTLLAGAAEITSLGTTVARAAVDQVNGNSFRNSGREFLSFKNTDSGARTVTIDSFPAGDLTKTPDGLTVNNRTVTVPAGAEVDVGPLPPSIYAVNGITNVDYDAATGLTVQVRRFVPNAG